VQYNGIFRKHIFKFKWYV